MKKNKMMRFASLVLVLTLMSTCAISGTFAKYVTTVSGQDEARTAVWDITADFAAEDTDGNSMFKAEYKSGEGESAKVTVKSAAEGEGETATYDLVVAPGTSDDYTYGMTGTPEVAYKVSFALDTNEGGDAINTSDITLKAGEYKFAEVYQDMDVTVETAYKPLKWKVTISTEKGTLTDDATGDKKFNIAADATEKATTLSFDSLAEIATALSTVTVAFDPNTECDVDVKIEWEWPFPTENSVENADKMDTVLGYYAAEAQGRFDNDDTTTDIPALPFTATGDDPGAILTVSYDFSMTATQVD